MPTTFEMIATIKKKVTEHGKVEIKRLHRTSFIEALETLILRYVFNSVIIFLIAPSTSFSSVFTHKHNCILRTPAPI